MFRASNDSIDRNKQNQTSPEINESYFTWPNELTDIVMGKIDLSPVSYGLFLRSSQISSSWRITSYFAALKKAHLASDHKVQQGLLTALYIHYPLLFKPNCNESVMHGIAWLKQYRRDYDILPESRLLAMALLLITHYIQEKFADSKFPKQEEEYQREFMLSAIHLMDKKPGLVNAVIAVLAECRGSLAKQMKDDIQYKINLHLSAECLKLTLKNMPAGYNDTKKITFTTQEALLVLAMRPNKEDQLIFSTLKAFNCEFTSESYLNFLHAALLHLSKDHSFWKDELALTHFLYQLPSKLSDKNNAAFTAVIGTLAKHIPDSSSFFTRFLDYQLMVTNTSTLTDKLIASIEIVKLKTEKEKYQWLKNNLYSSLSVEGAICSVSEFFLSQLETPEYLQNALNHLYQYFKVPKISHKVATICSQLLPKIKYEKFWIKWITDLTHDLSSVRYLSREAHIADIMISSLSFLPSEGMANGVLAQFFELQKTDPGNIINGKMLIALCCRLTSPPLIADWIEKISAQMNMTRIENLFIFMECYGVLLSQIASQRNIGGKLQEKTPDLISNFLPKLHTLLERRNDINPNVYQFTEKLLPYLAENDKEKWFIILLAHYNNPFRSIDPKSDCRKRQLIVCCLLTLIQNTHDEKTKKEFISTFSDNFIYASTDYNHMLPPLIHLSQKCNEAWINDLVTLTFSHYRTRIIHCDHTESLACYMDMVLMKPANDITHKSEIEAGHGTDAEGVHVCEDVQNFVMPKMGN